MELPAHFEHFTFFFCKIIGQKRAGVYLYLICGVERINTVVFTKKIRTAIDKKNISKKIKKRTLF